MSSGVQLGFKYTKIKQNS